MAKIEEMPCTMYLPDGTTYPMTGISFDQENYHEVLLHFAPDTMPNLPQGMKVWIQTDRVNEFQYGSVVALGEPDIATNTMPAHTEYSGDWAPVQATKIDIPPLPDWINIPFDENSPIYLQLVVGILPEAIRRGYEAVWLKSTSSVLSYIGPISLVENLPNAVIPFKDPEIQKREGEEVPFADLTQSIEWNAIAGLNPTHLFVYAWETRWGEDYDKFPGEMLFNEEVDLSVFHGDPASHKGTPYGFIIHSIQTGKIDMFVQQPEGKTPDEVMTERRMIALEYLASLVAMPMTAEVTAPAEPKKTRGRPVDPSKLKPSVIPPDTGWISTSMAKDLITESQLSPDKWKADYQKLEYIFTQPGSSIYLALTNNGSDLDAARARYAGDIEGYLAPIEELIAGYGDLSTDIQDILEMHWMEHKHKDGFATINLADLINYRMKPGKDFQMRLDDMIAYSNALIGVLAPEMRGRVDVERSEKKKYELDYTGKIWHWESISEGSNGLILTIRYAPGICMKYALQGATALSKQMVRVKRTIIQYDYYHEIKPKRLGRYITRQCRINRGSCILCMKTLLEGARIDITKKNEKHPGEFIREIENALYTLLDDGALGEYDCLDDGKPLPARGFLEPWLNRRWQFEPPRKIALAMHQTEVNREKAIENKKNAAEAARKRKAKSQNAN